MVFPSLKHDNVMSLNSKDITMFLNPYCGDIIIYGSTKSLKDKCYGTTYNPNGLDNNYDVE